MYQIKFDGGYEISVVGSGESGLCHVRDRGGMQTKSGTYAECVSWLAARGIAEQSADGTLAMLRTQKRSS